MIFNHDRQYQRSWPTTHSKQQLMEDYQENHDIPTTQDVKLACLMNDYEDDVPVPQVSNFLCVIMIEFSFILETVTYHRGRRLSSSKINLIYL